MDQHQSLTVVVKRHIILHKGLEVLAVVQHVLDHFLAVAVVVAAVTLQLIPQSPEKTIAEITQQSPVFTPAEPWLMY